MAVYGLALNTTANVNNTPAWGILAQADENPTIYEIHINLGVATLSTFGFGRAATAGTQTGAISVQPFAPGNSTTGKSTCATAWGTLPTAPTNYLRRHVLPATSGAGVIWTFPTGLGLASGGEMVIWNLSTNAANSNITVVCEE
jgi:hypothetical protein